MSAPPGESRVSLRDAYVGDTEDCAPFSWMFRDSADTVAMLAGAVTWPAAGSLGGVQAGQAGETEQYAALREIKTELIHSPVSNPVSNPVHNPPDSRSRRERRVSQNSYKKAQRYYGKTYIFTRTQVICAMLIAVGLIPILSALLFQAYVQFAQSLGLM